MATILIVDDEPLNRELLVACLDMAGHTLMEAATGEAALAQARVCRPDLVLLDVRMPGIDGFETCERIKDEARDHFLPVILITALSDDESKLRGLRAGADEFLAKPINRSELLLRVANLLALRSKEAALIQRNVELMELHRFREEMSAMIVHDLKNPLAAMMSNLEYVTSVDGGVPADLLDAITDTRSAGSRALRLLANLLDVARMEAGRLEPRRSREPVRKLVEPLLLERQHTVEARRIAVSTAIAADAEINADVELIGRVVENVFDNAIRYTPAGGRIAVNAASASDRLQLKIANSGTPIPPEARGRIFEKFGQADGAVGRMNLGLGLYFCRLAAEAHGGRIWVEESREYPTVFSLELPV